ncbi:MAG: hypothetical protein GY858_07215 [Candidatus Omnitrophica bacterium]|nr:hypothetical protein [Candidatus Omnitrophota bacterium]
MKETILNFYDKFLDLKGSILGGLLPLSFTKTLILVGVVFISTFAYLHQKVTVFVEAYQLTKNYHTYNDLVDERDYLLYNVSKEVSLPKINQWAKSNDFFFVGEEKVLAMDLREQRIPTLGSKLASVFSGFMKLPTGGATVLASDEQ